MVRFAVRFVRYSVRADISVSAVIAMTPSTMRPTVMSVAVAPGMTDVCWTEHRRWAGISVPAISGTNVAALRRKHAEYERQSPQSHQDLAFHKLCASYLVIRPDWQTDTEAKIERRIPGKVVKLTAYKHEKPLPLPKEA